MLAIISRSLARALSRLSSCLPPKTKQICTSNASAAPQKRSCDDGLYPPGSGFCNKVFLVIHQFPQQDGFQGSPGHGSI